jgi:2'-5' RNA ligase
VGVWGNIKPLVELHGQLGQALKEAIGFTPETRPYAPHLTIGRVNQEAPLQRLRQFSQIMEREQAVAQLVDLPVTEISLIKSELYPAGPVYTVLSSERLDDRP